MVARLRATNGSCDECFHRPNDIAELRRSAIFLASTGRVPADSERALKARGVRGMHLAANSSSITFGTWRDGGNPPMLLQ